ncbi:MAG: CDGSH iron-sulfur domain-containing protein [Candidatus Melainabacteria bacterium]|jgi:CDGSH-type Zn-finger protein
MSRKVIHKATGPVKVGDKWVCLCGLSKGWSEEEPQPFCDGSHNKARSEEEGKVYEYDSEGNAIPA